MAPSEYVWALVVFAGLAVFMVAADSGDHAPDAAFRPWIIPLAVVAGVVALAAVAAWRTRGPWRAFNLGALTGVVYGLLGPILEIVVSQLGREGSLATITDWPFYALVLTAVGGTACQQAAFHAGTLSASLPATQVLEPTVAVILGVWALHAPLGTRGWGWLALAVSVAAMASGTVALARSAASRPGA
jgi:hypothetical protein